MVNFLGADLVLTCVCGTVGTFGATPDNVLSATVTGKLSARLGILSLLLQLISILAPSRQPVNPTCPWQHQSLL